MRGEQELSERSDERVGGDGVMVMCAVVDDGHNGHDYHAGQAAVSYAHRQPQDARQEDARRCASREHGALSRG